MVANAKFPKSRHIAGDSFFGRRVVLQSRQFRHLEIAEQIFRDNLADPGCRNGHRRLFRNSGEGVKVVGNVGEFGVAENRISLVRHSLSVPANFRKRVKRAVRKTGEIGMRRLNGRVSHLNGIGGFL